MQANLNDIIIRGAHGVDLTHDLQYQPVVELVKGLRYKLLAAPSWQTPYIDLLKAPYQYGDRYFKACMTRLKRKQRMHAAIIEYLQNEWPVIHFKNLRQRTKSVWGQMPITRGYLDIGIHRMVVDRIVSPMKRVSTRLIVVYYVADPFLNRGGGC